jgi:hypothetical protein
MGRRGGAVVLAVVGSAVASVGLAHATTGSTNGFPQPKVHVAERLTDPFVGRYVLAEVGRSARIRNGELKLDYSESSSPEFLVGAVQFFGYDEDGRQSLSLDALYPFTWSHGRLRATVVSQGLTQVPLGRVSLKPPTAPDEVTGRLTLDGATFPITLRRLANGETVGSDPPPARRIADRPAPEPNRPGWGPDGSAFAGRYELTNGAPDPSASAAVLAPLVRAVQSFGGTGPSPSAGDLEVTAAPAGLLKLDTLGTASTLALTDLKWLGRRRTAVVHDTSPSGAVVGRFSGTAEGDRLSGTLVLDGESTPVRFRRVSATP